MEPEDKTMLWAFAILLLGLPAVVFLGVIGLALVGVPVG